MSDLNGTEKIKRNGLFTFGGLIVLAFITSQIPFVNLPFTWLQTYFHEISHGLAAVLTGGNVQSIELNLNGSGLCTTVGGIRFIVVFSGYLGAVLWGALIYTMVDNIAQKNAMIIAYVMIGVIFLSALFFGRDILTLVILGIITLPFVAILKTQSHFLVRNGLQFLGIYILLDAITSPLSLVGIGGYGDDHALSKLTGVPEFIWVVIWFSIGVFTLFRLWKNHVKREEI